MSFWSHLYRRIPLALLLLHLGGCRLNDCGKRAIHRGRARRKAGPTQHLCGVGMKVARRESSFLSLRFLSLIPYTHTTK